MTEQRIEELRRLTTDPSLEAFRPLAECLDEIEKLRKALADLQPYMEEDYQAAVPEYRAALDAARAALEGKEA